MGGTKYEMKQEWHWKIHSWIMNLMITFLFSMANKL